MATMKKAQRGAGVPKGYVRGEMSGKLMKESKLNKRTDEIAKDLEKGRKAMAKKAAPKKMKSGGKSFPDLNKDGKITKADILKGRGVIAKKGVKVKKAQAGTAAPMKVGLRAGQMKRLGRLAAKNPDKATKVGSRMVERATRKQRGKEFLQKNLSSLMPQSRSGSKMKKCKYGCK
jgi:hypothetical protein